MTNTELALLRSIAADLYVSLRAGDSVLPVALDLALRGYVRRLSVISASVFEFALTGTGESALRLCAAR